MSVGSSARFAPRGVKPGSATLAAIAFVLLPLALSEADVYKLGLVAILFVAAIGLHILVNWAGELSLAHAAMVGAPAFVVATISVDHGVSTVWLLPIGAATGAVIGTVIGLPALRARGLQVALVTLVAGVGIERYLFTKEWFAGPASGASVEPPDLGFVDLVTSRSQWPLLASIVVVVVVATWMAFRSKLARGLQWAAADEAAAAAFGIPVGRYRTMAFALAGVCAGLAGALTTMWVQRLTSQAFPLTLSFTYLIVAALAGPGFVGGVALAAAFVEGGRLFLPGADALIVYGAPIGVILTLTMYRGGLNGALAQSADAVRRRRARHAARDDEPAASLAPPDATLPRRDSRAILEVHDARVSFGGLQAVDGVSLRVDEGTIVGLIGPNGAGKTTLFNGITGHQRLDGGRVVFDDHDVTRRRPHVRARLGMGRSFQNLGLMRHETAQRNVEAAQHLGAGYAGWDIVLRPWRWWRAERRIATRAASALGALGLAGERERPVEDLPFAAARFVELAAVLVEGPRLVLLDEPTTGLDLAETQTLLSVLQRVRAEGATVVVIAHDVGFVMDVCDRVYVLAEGRVIAEGPPDEVQRDPAVIEAYLGVSA